VAIHSFLEVRETSTQLFVFNDEFVVVLQEVVQTCVDEVGVSVLLNFSHEYVHHLEQQLVRVFKSLGVVEVEAGQRNELQLHTRGADALQVFRYFTR
jgi:hypothetical protein